MFKLLFLLLTILINFLVSQILNVNGVNATIPVVVISGSKQEMGIQYGKLFKDYMLGALQI